MSARESREEIPTGELLHSAIVVGKFGENQMVQGWHERETDGRNGMPYRASNGLSLLQLKRAPGATKLCLILASPVSLAGGFVEGMIVINKVKHQLPIGVDTWVLRNYPITTDRAMVKVRFFLQNPIVPDKLLHNGDARQMAFYVSAVWQE